MKIHIIGGGNLGVSIALGLVRFAPQHEVTVTRRNLSAIASLPEKGIRITSDNTEDIAAADIIILTVKPYQVDAVLEEILPAAPGKIVASAVSGLTLEALEAKAPANPCVRIMPNIAAQFGASATCISHGSGTKEAAGKVIEVFSALGTVPVIDDKLMDAATVLGACGTAYALRYVRASMQAGIEIGFDSQTALAIAAQTVKGAAEMLLEENLHPEQLIDKVTTPQGCTIVGLNEMEHQGFSSSLITGIKASLKKIKG